ncbi:hypothetical protein BJX68DRAFT_243998 [Aspergillus pseudodeflectus]|uniref:C2H2-type domain-containing protein n=1 Tax=Aspergillus pseudodeflectus TaxID=176178 RepID=A0ABR4JTT4_9EURO
MIPCPVPATFHLMYIFTTLGGYLKLLMASSLLPASDMQHHFPFLHQPSLDNLNPGSLLSFPSACNPSMTFEPHTYFNGATSILSHATTDQFTLGRPTEIQDTPQPMLHPEWLFTTNTPIILPCDKQRTTTECHVQKPRSQARRSPASFKCKWEGCRSSTVFRRIGDLTRHIRTIHILPTAYQCPANHCGKAFGRKDHLKEHMKGCKRQVEEA